MIQVVLTLRHDILKVWWYRAKWTELNFIGIRVLRFWIKEEGGSADTGCYCRVT